MINFAIVALCASWCSLGQYDAEVAGAYAGVRYELLEGSTITDLNGPVTVPATLPLRGSFVLKRLPLGAPFDGYALEHIHWSASNPGGPIHRIVGSGMYALIDPAAGGQHSLTLQVGIDFNTNTRQLYSGWVARDVPFSTIEITATEDPGGAQHYRIHLIAEPLRIYLFSTEIGFGSWQPNGLVPMSDGDLLVSAGRRLRTNAQLTQHLGIMPPAPDIGLDAVTLTPASASIVFSPEVNVFSEWLGPLQHGDLLNEHGFVFQTNQELTAAFVSMPPAPDVGLDAIDFALSTGQTWFSIETPLFSERLGVTLQPGDVLADDGHIVRTSAQLLSRFHVVNPSITSIGLDALHVLPNGVILFSTDAGFYNTFLGWVSDGDLLSENGHVIRRNLQLMAPFQPAEDVDNFGLDGLYVLQTVWTADADHNGTVDAGDYAALLACLTGPINASSPDCTWSDLDVDGLVDLCDVAMFQALVGAN